ncbi:MAG: BspA family leucine-rich repeat surface protein [Clostridia bacterium]|nr:BspA family leucine-rich repeat surface protein [Clostridia bacterium]MBQ9785697.1 BspA family leucine-rich repeat surface protein [Clostridia bacterium]
MSKRVSMLAIVLTVLSFLFLCVGFAELQDTLLIEGSASYAKGERILQTGAATATIISNAISDDSITRIVVDNQKNSEAILAEYSLAWEDGVDVGIYGNTVKVFVIPERSTAYLLAKGTGIVCANADSAGLFSGLTDIVRIEFNRFDTSAVTDMSSMFEGCTALERVNFNACDIEGVTSLANLFAGCESLTGVSLDGMNAASLLTAENMFSGCTSLESADLSQFATTSALTHIGGMFENCVSLQTVDLSNLNTSGVLSMAATFRHCEALPSITGLNELDTSSVTSFENTFAYCYSFTSLDLSAFETDSATNMAGMFGGCYALTELDLSVFNTAKVTDFSYMFANRGAAAEDAAADSPMQLTTIIISRSWSKRSGTSSTGMFSGSELLVGGNGTAYDAAVLDQTYAHADLEKTPGYLTWYREVNCVLYLHANVYTTADRLKYVLGDDIIDALIYTEYDETVVFPAAYNSDTVGWSEYVYADDANPPHAIDSSIVLKDLTGDETTTEMHLYDMRTSVGTTIHERTSRVYELPILMDFTYASESDPRNGTMITKTYTVTDGTADQFIYIYANIRVQFYEEGFIYEGEEEELFVIFTNQEGESTYFDNNGEYFNITYYSYYGTTKIEPWTNLANPSCFASGTMITLADGTQKPVEELTGDELVLAFNHETGKFEAQPIMFMENDGEREWEVINLIMSDGTHLRYIYEHGLFDLTTGGYVYVTAQNYKDLIGHTFAKQAGDGFESVELVDAYLTTEVTGCYSFPSMYHMNVLTDGFLSYPGGLTGLFNIFAYDEDLKYDPERMQADIERYGLYTYEDFADYMSREVFESVFPIPYLKVAVGKGLIDEAGMLDIIEKYLYKHGIASPTEETP